MKTSMNTFSSAGDPDPTWQQGGNRRRACGAYMFRGW